MGGTSQLPMRSHSAQDVRNAHMVLPWHQVGACIPVLGSIREGWKMTNSLATEIVHSCNYYIL